MKKNRLEGKKIWILAFIVLILSGNGLFSQVAEFQKRISQIPGFTISQVPNSNFAGYYVLGFEQPLDHQNRGAGTFSQRMFVGIQNLSAPVVMVTDGYGVDYAAKPDHTHELAKALNANLVVVEHRFFGKSQPAVLDYQWLTVAQAAADIHAIKLLLEKVLVGKWISTGTSKGGQANLAHRMYFPSDVVASVVYGTAVKKMPTISTSALLKPLMETDCGKRIAQLQLHCFQHREQLFPAFVALVAESGLEFGDMSLDVVFDYALLEFPFSFWQGGGECDAVPKLEATPREQVDFLCKIVPPKYYTPATRRRWMPAYYMFYKELGYYEYDLAAFKAYLSQAAYPNQFFAPVEAEIKFDRSYLESLRDFLDAPAAHSVFFVYGENDPWALQSVVVDNKYVVSHGSHKSKIADLPTELREDLLRRIQLCLGSESPSAPK